MEEWHYDPSEDDAGAPIERLRGLLRQPWPVRGLRRLANMVVRCWLRFYHRFEIIGGHNLPLQRSFMLIANHASHLDTLCLLAALPACRLDRAFPLAARDYFCVSVLRGLLARLVVNALPFERTFAPWQSLGVCAQLLQEAGTVLILFPEGTRSGSAEPAEFKPGVALLAAGRDVPVVPCHLSGTHAALPKGAWFPRPKALRLTIGAPCLFTHPPATREAATQICRQLREAVIALGSSRPEGNVIPAPPASRPCAGSCGEGMPPGAVESPILQP
jgi:1-acyl-sn-glycerol-3-phosphate acyltransferase